MKKLVIVILIILIVIGIIGYQIFSYIKPKTTHRSTHIDTLPIQAHIPIQITKIADNLESPRSMVRTSPNRALITEKPGRVRVLQDGIVQTKPILIIPDITGQGKEGLMDITIHPDYHNNKYVYLAYAYTHADQMYVKVVRYKDETNTLSYDKTIFDKLPAAEQHAGTALKFGPDNMLYISVGDAIQGEKAQFPDYYHGKILRIHPDGTIPKDNPYKDYATWSLGHRNCQGIDRNSQGVLYAIDHGPRIFDGPPGGDEINIIYTGSNHGRPLVSHEKTQTGMIDPIAIYTPAILPSSLMIYQGNMFPERKDNLFVSMMKRKGILKITIDTDNPRKIIHQEKIIDSKYGKIRFVSQAPDGSIYFITNNTDTTRSKTQPTDAIYRIRRRK